MLGRPPKFENVESLQKAIDEFFDSCKPEIVRDNNGNVILDKNNMPLLRMNPPTITGLALHLGFVSRRSIYDYENRNDDFSHTIKKARLKCENYIEKGLYTGEIPAAAGIFSLKNFGWSDKQDIDLNSENKVDIQIEIIDAGSGE